MTLEMRQQYYSIQNQVNLISWPARPWRSSFKWYRNVHQQSQRSSYDSNIHTQKQTRTTTAPNDPRIIPTNAQAERPPLLSSSGLEVLVGISLLPGALVPTE